MKVLFALLALASFGSLLSAQEAAPASSSGGSDGNSLNSTESPWCMLRQTDLTTGYTIDRLVDSAGSGNSSWNANAGARFDVYWLQYGKTRWNLTSSLAVLPGGSVQVSLTTFDPTSAATTQSGEPVELSVHVPPGGDYLLSIDGEDALAEPLEHYGSYTFSGPFSMSVKAENLDGRDVFRVFQKRNDQWVLLAKNSIMVKPGPVCKWNLGTNPVFDGSLPILDLIGKGLHPKSVVRVELLGGLFTKKVLIEYSQQEKFDLNRDLAAMDLGKGKYSIVVWYKSPQGQKSQVPETWPERQLFAQTFEVR